MKNKYFYSIFILFCFINNSFGQSVTWGPAIPAGSANSLEVYNGNSTATFEFTNNGIPMSNVMLQVDMGVGVVYDGGLVSTTSESAIITAISTIGDSPALFNIDNIAAGEQITFSFSRSATCIARDHKTMGGTFADTLHISTGGMEVSYSNNSNEAYAATYDVTYANLVVGAVSHSPSAAMAVGETVTRSYNVTNGSFGAVNEFWLTDYFNTSELMLANFRVNGVAIPTANITVNTDGYLVYFDAGVISNINGASGTIGDSDTFFEKDEFFTLSYDLTMLECGIGNSTPSNITAFYGLDVNTPCLPNGTNTTSVSVKNGVPELQLTIIDNPAMELCNEVRKCVRIRNTATGVEDFAMDLSVLHGSGGNDTPISSPSNNILNLSNVLTRENYTINDSLVTLTAPPSGHASISYIGFDIYGTDIDGPGGLDDLDNDGFFDDLGPGIEIVVCYDIDLTPFDVSCGIGRSDILKWEHDYFDVNHKNQCGVDRTGLRVDLSYNNFIRDYFISTTGLGPTDINDKDSFQLVINPNLQAYGSPINCNGTELNNLNPDFEFTVALALPSGVSLTSTVPNLNNSSFNSVITTNATGDTVFYTINRTSFTDTEFYFDLAFDCDLWDSTTPLVFPYTTSAKCGDCYEDNDIHCATIEMVPHCPGCEGAISTTSLSSKRTTAGFTDNTMTQTVDLTEGVHALDWLLPFDKYTVTAPGVMSNAETENVYFRLTYTPDNGADVTNFEEGEVTFYDTDAQFGSNYYTFPVPTPTIIDLGNGSFEALFDFTATMDLIDPAFVLGRGAGGMGTFDSDSVNLELIFSLKNNFPTSVVNSLNMRGQHFFLDAANMEQSCNNYGAVMFYEYPTIRAANRLGPFRRGCEEMLVGITGVVDSGTDDPFPDEFRPIYRVDSTIYQAPVGFEFTGTTQALAISSGDTTYYNAAGDLVLKSIDYNLYDTRGTHYPRFLAGFTGSCTVAPGIKNFPTTIYYSEYIYSDSIQTGVLSGLHRNNYEGTSFVLTPLNQVVQGVSDTISWDIEICNQTATLGTDYGYLILKDSTAGLDIDRVMDISTGTEIATTLVDFGGGNTLVQLGEIAGATCKTVRIYAAYSTCVDEVLDVQYSYSCVAYPTTMAEVVDCMQDTRLEVHDLAAAISATITPLQNTPTDPNNPAAGNFDSNLIDMCEEFPVEMRFISSDVGSLYDINFDILIPNAGTGLEYVAGSGTIEIEGVDATNMPRAWDTSGEMQFANGTGSNFNIVLADLDATNFDGKGLIGAGQNPTMNELILRWKMKSTCSLNSGSPLRTVVYANKFCGETAIGNGERIKSSNYNLNGITLPYSASISSTITPDASFTNCSQTKNIAIDLILSGGTTGSDDSLYINLPLGIVLDGTVNCTSVDCPTYVRTDETPTGQSIVFSYPEGVTNPTYNINFDLSSSKNTTCDDENLEILSTAIITGLFCEGVSCGNTTVITGSTNLDISINKPTIMLSSFDAIYCPLDASLDLADVNVIVSDIAIQADESLKVRFFCVDNTGQAAGLALDSVTVQGPAAVGETLVFDKIIDTQSCDITNGIIGLVENNLNCICETTELLFDYPSYSFCPDYQDYSNSLNPCLQPACHIVSTDLYLGTGVTSDESTFGDTNADRDMDDGIIILPNMQFVPGNTVHIPVVIYNNRGIDAYLRVWIDWNGDGDFEDANEQVEDNTYASTGTMETIHLSVTIPANANQSQQIALRARLSTDNLNSALACGTGDCAADGEVEDYLLEVNCLEPICLPAQLNRKD